MITLVELGFRDLNNMPCVMSVLYDPEDGSFNLYYQVNDEVLISQVDPFFVASLGVMLNFTMQSVIRDFGVESPHTVKQSNNGE